MAKNVNRTARMQWKVDTIKSCIYLQCGSVKKIWLIKITYFLKSGCRPSLYRMKINQYFIFLIFAETVYQFITIFLWGRTRKIKILSWILSLQLKIEGFADFFVGTTEQCCADLSVLQILVLYYIEAFNTSWGKIVRILGYSQYLEWA